MKKMHFRSIFLMFLRKVFNIFIKQNSNKEILGIRNIRYHIRYIGKILGIKNIGLYQKYRVSEISDIRNIGYQKYKVSINISFELSIIYY